MPLLMLQFLHLLPLICKDKIKLAGVFLLTVK